MKSIKPDRFSELCLRNGRRLRNRVVVPPMASETAAFDGSATQATFEHYARLAQSGAGLVFVEYTFVEAAGRSEQNQLGIAHDKHLAGLRQIARIIHEAGAVAGIQLTHAGGKSSRDLTLGPLPSPSGITVPVKDRQLETPDVMSLAAIEQWKQAFADGVARAASAGFDVVEFHAAHGYGLNQWLSPLTNIRCDDYGATRAGRLRLLLEVVQSARHAEPGLLLSVRMPGQDFIEGGLSPQEAVEIARALEAAGVDLIDVSSGIGGWRRPRDRSGEGYLVSEAAAIQREIGVPVIAVGGIESGSFIDRGLSEGKFSLAAVGRAILGNPNEWGSQNLARPAAPQYFY